MIENFTDYRIETSEDTRAKMVRAFGFDEPPHAEKLSRADFDSDEAYFSAVAETSVRHNSPEFRAAYKAVRREYNERKAAEEAEKAERQHQEEIQKAIRDCVLRPEEQAAVDAEARRQVQADLVAGRITYDQMGTYMEEFAARLTQAKKADKVHAADFNAQLRAAMSQVVAGRRGTM